MELSIACPLCSQPGFSDVNSLWLTLIRVTTRQLTCPVCQEVLCGLDKLTIHLVSHSLHDQLIQACLASNLSTPPAILVKGVQFNKSSQCVESATIQESVTTGSQPPHNPSPSSYVLVNLPSLGNVSTKEMVPGSVSSNVGLTPSKEDVPFPYLSPPKPGYPQVLVAKANDSPLVTDSIPPLTSVMCPDTLSDPLKLVNLDHSRQRTTTIKDIPVIKRISCGNVLNHNSPHQLPQIKPSEHEGSLNHQIASIPKVESPSHVSDLCCEVCGLTFKDNNIALLHQQLIHHQNPPDDYQVSSKLEDRPHSSKQRSRRGNVNQLRDGSLHRFPCHICNKVFRMRGSLMVHLRVAHSPNETMGFASKLGVVSTALSPQSDVTSKLCLQNLSIQEGTQSFSTDENISDNGHEETKENDLTTQKTSDLALQNISTSLGYKHNSSMFTKNLTSDSNTSESTVSTMVVPSPYGQTESIGMIFPCNLCNKTYSKEILLQQHLKSHDSKQWECDVCFKSFTTKYFLKKHKRLHTGEMPYTCGICNKSFTFQQSYHKHLLYHSDEKPHSCSECGRAFKELSTLHNHQRIHTGEKPWACESCDATLCV